LTHIEAGDQKGAIFKVILSNRHNILLTAKNLYLYCGLLAVNKESLKTGVKNGNVYGKTTAKTPTVLI
jgi:uncharacterized protein YunC (DUF1805 family)